MVTLMFNHLRNKDYFTVTRPFNIPVAQMVKKSPAMQETWVQSLGWEDPLQKEMATHSSILAWRIPEMAEPGGLPFMGSHGVGQTEATQQQCVLGLP